jgi:hypothetical protein
MEKSFTQEMDKQAGNPFSRSPALVARELHFLWVCNKIHPDDF